MSKKWIEGYRFGKIKIDGEVYTDDVILLDRDVESGWWRERGHSVNLSDLEKIIEFDPERLIIGTGSGGNMRVPDHVIDELDFVVEVHPTEKACMRYNEELDRDKKIAGGFHLTC